MNPSLKPRIYLIPGLGVDERLFENLTFDDHQTHVIRWQTISPGERLPDYAQRLAAQIDFYGPVVLIGVSFGSMLAVEIAKHHPVRACILISGAARSSELPFVVRMLRYFPIHLLIPESWLVAMAIKSRRIFGVSKENVPLFKRMLQNCPQPYYRGAIHAIIHWKNCELPSNLFRLHGRKDRLISPENCPVDQQHPSGTHFLVHDEGAWCSLQILRFLHEMGF